MQIKNIFVLALASLAAVRIPPFHMLRSISINTVPQADIFDKIADGFDNIGDDVESIFNGITSDSGSFWSSIASEASSVASSYSSGKSTSFP